MRSRTLAGLLVIVMAGCAGIDNSGPTDGSPPQILITAPLDRATVNGVVSIDVTAVDDFGVDRVRIFIDNVQLAEMFTAPFHAVWNTNTLADNSTHNIRVDASDVAGNSSTVGIQVTVVHGPN